MKEPAETSGKTLICDFLILADGTIFAHNLTPVMAGLLADLNPADASMQQRVSAGETRKTDLFEKSFKGKKESS